jgi:ArsR family transcriptional regulator
MNVTEIVAALKLVSQPTVSHHLGILRGAGLVKVRREGKQVYYTLDQDRLASACCVLSENFAPEHKLVLSTQQGA